MNCPSCGASLARGAKFCSSCGTAVQTPMPVQTQTLAKPTKEPISGALKLLIGLVAVVVIAVVIGVVISANSKKGPEHSGQTEADQTIAAQVASYLVENGQSEHVTWVKVVQGDVIVYTDLDGSMPTALQHSKAVDICDAARATAPNNSDISIWNTARLPIWAC